MSVVNGVKVLAFVLAAALALIIGSSLIARGAEGPVCPDQNKAISVILKNIDSFQDLNGIDVYVDEKEVPKIIAAIGLGEPPFPVDAVYVAHLKSDETIVNVALVYQDCIQHVFPSVPLPVWEAIMRKARGQNI